MINRCGISQTRQIRLSRAEQPDEDAVERFQIRHGVIGDHAAGGVDARQHRLIGHRERRVGAALSADLVHDRADFIAARGINR